MQYRVLLGLLACFAVACGDDSPGGDNEGNNDPDHTGQQSSGSSVPTKPLSFTAGDALELKVGTVTNYAVIPHGYDATHNTPTMVFVYLHGCGGASSDDVYAAGGFDTAWIGLAPGGAEGDCWDDQAKSAKIVMDAIADLKTHFNVDPKRVHIGGYSSGGDLSYYTGLRNAGSFAGILSYNSIPAYSANSLQQEIAAASWKLNIVHLAHTSDGTYAIADVRARFQALDNAGFPVNLIERPGAHYDDNTTEERNSLVYPHLADGWKAP